MIMGLAHMTRAMRMLVRNHCSPPSVHTYVERGAQCPLTLARVPMPLVRVRVVMRTVHMTAPGHILYIDLRRRSRQAPRRE